MRGNGALVPLMGGTLGGLGLVCFVVLQSSEEPAQVSMEGGRPWLCQCTHLGCDELLGGCSPPADRSIHT